MATQTPYGQMPSYVQYHPAPPSPPRLQRSNGYSKPPTLYVPKNAVNTITGEAIKDGDMMVNFHGERELGRFYHSTSYTQLNPPRNPYTRRNINDGDVTWYYAKRLNGGKRRYKKTLKRKSRKNRK
jgi:hypothetical protein